MKRTAILVAGVMVVLPQCATGQPESDVREIAEAVSALPENLRSAATVKSFRDGELVTIREGSNGMVCLADDPRAEGWHVACYHESLEPFMARGRELRAQGVTTRAAIDSARGGEIEAGVLRMPEGPAALYSVSSDEGSFAAAGGVPPGATGLHVIYMAYATEASTGISAKPSRERPWLMSPGTPWAHVMIAR